MNRREAIAALMSLPAAATVCEAKVQPEDVIVIQHPRYLSDQQNDAIRRCMEQVWPGRRCVVLDDGMTLQIARGLPAGVGTRT